ncbi:MAG: hypothetical protein QOI39_3716 [Mycobacterium sp.]|nr:hypothetical protein [Mycobacterium sp.]
MAAVDGTGPLTRSRIEAFVQTAAVLSSSATQWRSQAQQLEQTADAYVDQINTPNGTQWNGRTAVSYFDTAHADRLALLPAVTHVHAMADVAEQGGESLRGAQLAALEAIAVAEADDFSVGEDLSSTDNYAWNSPTVRAAREAAAVGHRNYIAYQAGLLEAESQRIAAQLNAGATQMAGMAPAHWRQPVTEYAQPVSSNPGAATLAGAIADNRRSTIQAVDNDTWKQDPVSPIPDPTNMTEAEARAAWDAVNADVADYNARCGRTFLLPNEQSAYNACIASRGPLLERQAAIRARLKDLGVPIRDEESAPPPASETSGDSPPFPPPRQITGFTDHGAEQVNGRDGHGVNDVALQDSVANPIGSPKFRPDQYGGTYTYVGTDATVVLNRDGQVVTAWANSRDGWRNP